MFIELRQPRDRVRRLGRSKLDIGYLQNDDETTQQRELAKNLALFDLFPRRRIAVAVRKVDTELAIARITCACSG